MPDWQPTQHQTNIRMPETRESVLEVVLQSSWHKDSTLILAMDAVRRCAEIRRQAEHDDSDSLLAAAGRGVGPFTCWAVYKPRRTRPDCSGGRRRSAASLDTRACDAATASCCAASAADVPACGQGRGRLAVRARHRSTSGAGPGSGLASGPYCGDCLRNSRY